MDQQGVKAPGRPMIRTFLPAHALRTSRKTGGLNSKPSCVRYGCIVSTARVGRLSSAARRRAGVRFSTGARRQACVLAVLTAGRELLGAVLTVSFGRAAPPVPWPRSSYAGWPVAGAASLWHLCLTRAKRVDCGALLCWTLRARMDLHVRDGIASLHHRCVSARALL